MRKKQVSTNTRFSTSIDFKYKFVKDRRYDVLHCIYEALINNIAQRKIPLDKPLFRISNIFKDIVDQEERNPQKCIACKRIVIIVNKNNIYWEIIQE